MERETSTSHCHRLLAPLARRDNAGRRQGRARGRVNPSIRQPQLGEPEADGGHESFCDS